MTKSEVKEILEKQLQLLSEASKNYGDLYSFSNTSLAMCEIVKVLVSLEDGHGIA